MRNKTGTELSLCNFDFYRNACKLEAHKSQKDISRYLCRSKFIVRYPSFFLHETVVHGRALNKEVRAEEIVFCRLLSFFCKTTDPIEWLCYLCRPIQSC